VVLADLIERIKAEDPADERQLADRRGEQSRTGSAPARRLADRTATNSPRLPRPMNSGHPVPTE